MAKEFKSFYKTVGGGEGEKCYYPTRLDPYGKGCYYNCKYCYAKKLLNFRKMWHPNNVSVADIEKIRKTIHDKVPKGSTVRLGGMTDCFQPIEEKTRTTYNTILELNNKGVHYLIVTKSPLVATKEYMDILDHELAHIQVSVPTTDNKTLEATDNAPSYNERVTAIEKLQKEGYDVCIRLSPFLFESTDFDELNKVRVDKCLVEFLRTTPKIAETLKNHISFKDYTVKEGGYRHLPLEKKIQILDKLRFKEISVCDDVATHYDYFQKNYNHNPQDCCNLRR